MKKVFQLVSVFALVLSFGACNQGGGVPTITGDVKLETIQDSLTYGFGVLVMNALSEQFEIKNVNQALVVRAMQDVEDSTALFTDEQFNTIAQQYFVRKQAEAGEANVTKGKQYLEDNAKKDGVTTTESGLQYSVISASGSGKRASAEDRVTVHYTGTLIDGTVFDSSVERGQPATFPVTGVIPGWIEALQLMEVGDKWKLYIPSDLAYGARGSGPSIGPNEVLIFDVELLSIAE